MRKLLTLILICAGSFLFGQGVVRIDGNTLYSSVEDKIKPGTTVLFGPNAALIITDGVSIRGNETERIIFRSEDISNPGRGIVFQTSRPNDKTVEFRHVIFKQLKEAVYFESYNQFTWIEFREVQILSSGHEGSALSFYNMIASGAKGNTKIIFKDSKFVGNLGGFEFYGVDDEVSSLDFSNVLFAYNTNFKSDDELLKIESFSTNQEKIIKLQNLVFLRNTELADSSPWTLALSGVRDTLSPATMYISNKDEGAILDGRNEYNRSYLPVRRLPSLPAFASSYNALPEFKFKGDTIHSPQAKQVEQIYKSNGESLEFSTWGDSRITVNELPKGSTLIIRLQDGRVAKLDVEEEPVEEVPEEIVEEEKEGNALLADSLATLVSNDQIQLIIDPIRKKRFQEVGMLLGINYYIGDVNLSGLFPSSLDYAFSLNYNYVHDEYWSFGVRYQLTRIAMGKPSILRISDPKNSHSFKNAIHSIRGDAFYSLWKRKQGKSVYGYLTGEIGLGLGFHYFDPKMFGRPGGAGTEAGYFSVREYGTEGQNFLEGEDTYGYVAIEIVPSARLRWSLGSLSLFVEGAWAISTTDYLDDVSDGFYYGGDRSLAQETDPYYFFFSDPGGQGASLIDENPRKDYVRGAGNGLPDSFVTFMVGAMFQLD